MQLITIKTLFDITQTKVLRNFKPEFLSPNKYKTEEEYTKARSQQINFETVLQVMSLRAQPNVRRQFKKTEGLDIFGRRGKGTVWTIEVEVEHDDVYRDGKDGIGLLKHDIENIPMITGLDETQKNIAVLQNGSTVVLEIDDIQM